MEYTKARKYPDLDRIYAQCSGPGGLKLAEFMAEKLRLRDGARLLDVGTNRGYQTCFLAREYGVQVVGIDPWDDREDGRPMIEHVRSNADEWGVADSVLALKLGVPDTGFASSSFDRVYSTTALEMLRMIGGQELYMQALREVYRVLRPNGVFGLGEPMHLDVALPPDLAPFVSEGKGSWKECFRSLRETSDAIREAGFNIVEAEYALDARSWWLEYARHDPFCKLKPEEDPKALEVDKGRWVSFGYVIATKPA